MAELGTTQESRHFASAATPAGGQAAGVSNFAAEHQQGSAETSDIGPGYTGSTPHPSDNTVVIPEPTSPRKWLIILRDSGCAGPAPSYVTFQSTDPTADYPDPPPCGGPLVDRRTVPLT